MLSFVWVRAGSTIKSRGRMFTSAPLKGIGTHTRETPASSPGRAHWPAAGKRGGMRCV
jgi:hypothetical protein